MSDEILKKLYYDPKFGLLGKAKFKLKVRDLHPTITNKEIDDFVKKQSLQQVNSKSPFKGFYKIVAPPRHFQMDVFFMSPYKSSNNGISMFLIFIDILSRKMFVEPIKNRTQETLLEGIKMLVAKVKEVKGLEGDAEFGASKIESFCDEHGIILSFDVAKDDHIDKGNKLGIVDTACRTIKRAIRNYMIAHDTTKFISVLPNLVDNYNETPHSSLRNYTPDQVYDDLEYQQETFNQLSKYNNKLDDKIDLDVGDRVRKRVDKGKFDKENAKFSSEIYIVYEKVGRKYLIIDEQGNEQPRKYKYFELLKVEPNKVEGKASGLDKIEKAKKAHRKKTKVDRQHKMIDVVDSVITKRKVIEIPAAPPKETKKKEKRKVDVIDGETHVEIDKFVDSKFKDGSLQYLVKWKNEPNTNNLWIPAKQLVQDLSSDAFRRFRNALKETKKN